MIECIATSASASAAVATPASTTGNPQFRRSSTSSSSTVDRAFDPSTLRVGFVCSGDATNPGLLSGMPYQAMRALSGLGVQIVPLFPRQSPRESNRWVPEALRRNVRARAIRSSVRRRIAGTRLRWSSVREYDQQLRHAERVSAELNDRIEQLDTPIDLLFGMCISTQLYAIEHKGPIVYFSDATARLINTTYPKYQRRSIHYKRACNAIEQTALARVDAGIFSSQRTVDSAVLDYGLPPERAYLLPIGANIMPEGNDCIEPDIPSRDRLELAIVATDPVRKRLDFCVQITRELARRGWNVILHAIGGCTWRAATCARVRSYGSLNLADRAHRKLHQSILRRSHFMLLPSVGEMFGIAPCEAAHFGRPAIVSDVGGLPTAVLHHHTGVCLPVDAPAAMYADHIEQLSNDDDAYRAMSAAALERARTVLNWPTFARGVVQVFEQVLHHNPPVPTVLLARKPSPSAACG